MPINFVEEQRIANDVVSRVARRGINRGHLFGKMGRPAWRFLLLFLLFYCFPPPLSRTPRVYTDRVEGRRCVNAFLRMQGKARDVGGFYVLLSGERKIDIIFIYNLMQGKRFLYFISNKF